MQNFRIKNFLKSIIRWEVLIFIITFGIIIFTRTWNLFNFPYYENDEGTYMSQAWAITDLNKLSPYTYWYDHSPLGWILLGIFSYMIGGYNTFGNAVNTGRVVILIMHLITCLYIILSMKKITKHQYAPYITVLFFTLIPTVHYFQRRVLLDNIMVMFIAMSLYYVIDKKITLTKTIISGFLFGLAILSKESAVVFFPIYLILLATGLDIKNRFLGIFSWISFAFITGFTYILMALLKTELLPSTDKVSLLNSLLFQSSRGTGLPFWVEKSDFRDALIQISNKDYFSNFIIPLTIFTVYLYVLLFKTKNRIHVSLISMFTIYLAFLMRGKIVLEFYFLPLILPLSMTIGLLYDDLVNILRFSGEYQKLKVKFVQLLAFSISVFLIISPQYILNTEAFSLDQAVKYNQTMEWFYQNVDKEAKIMIDYGLYPNFRLPKDKSKTYPNADWYWKADFDKEIKSDKLDNQPLNIDYIHLTSQYLSNIERGDIPFSLKAFNESKRVYRNTDTRLISEVYKVIKDKDLIVNNTWNNYKKKFIKDNFVIDNRTLQTDPRNHADALKLSLLFNDKDTFEKLYEGFLDKFYVPNYLVLSNDPNFTTNSDINVNFIGVLIEGFKKFKIKGADIIAENLIENLWNNRVKEIKGNYYLIDENINNENYSIAISGYKPHYFTLFNQYSSHNWTKLSNDYLNTINQTTKIYILPPNYFLINTDGQITIALNQDNGNGSNFGYLSYRIFLNLYEKILTKPLNVSEKQFLTNHKYFIESEYKKNNIIASSYNIFGKPVHNYQTQATDASFMAFLDMQDSKVKGKFWREKFIERIDIDRNTFEDEENLNNQTSFLLYLKLREKNKL
jgi:Dolichyl-phosphate-mannose-protein mannosyltransferase/Glycosyl hydrolases family 8